MNNLSIEKLKDARVTYKVKRDLVAVSIIDELISIREENTNQAKAKQITVTLPISVCADQLKPYYKVFLRGDIMEILNKNGIEFMEEEVNLKLNSSLEEISNLIQPFKKDDIVKMEISCTGIFDYFRVTYAHDNGSLDVVGLGNGTSYGLTASWCILHERLYK